MLRYNLYVRGREGQPRGQPHRPAFRDGSGQKVGWEEEEAPCAKEREANGLLHHTELSTPILGPSGIVAGWINGHFGTKTDGLNIVSLHTLGDQSLAHG